MFLPVVIVTKNVHLKKILYVHEVVTILSTNFLYKMGHNFLDRRYNMSDVFGDLVIPKDFMYSHTIIFYLFPLSLSLMVIYYNLKISGWNPWSIIIMFQSFFASDATRMFYSYLFN